MLQKSQSAHTEAIRTVRNWKCAISSSSPSHKVTVVLLPCTVLFTLCTSWPQRTKPQSLHRHANALQSCTAHDAACITWPSLEAGWCALALAAREVIVRVCWGRDVVFNSGGIQCTWFQSLTKLSILCKRRVCLSMFSVFTIYLCCSKAWKQLPGLTVAVLRRDAEQPSHALYLKRGALWSVATGLWSVWSLAIQAWKAWQGYSYPYVTQETSPFM